MNYTLKIPLMPKYNPVDLNIPSFPSINYIEINLQDLINNRRSIIETIDKNNGNLKFYQLIIICDWLYEWYKKTALDNYPISNWILDSFLYTLSIANNSRELK